MIAGWISDLDWYAEFLLRIDLRSSLGKTVAKFNLKIMLKSLHTGSGLKMSAGSSLTWCIPATAKGIRNCAEKKSLWGTTNCSRTWLHSGTLMRSVPCFAVWRTDVRTSLMEATFRWKDMRFRINLCYPFDLLSYNCRFSTDGVKESNGVNDYLLSSIRCFLGRSTSRIKYL